MILEFLLWFWSKIYLTFNEKSFIKGTLKPKIEKFAEKFANFSPSSL